MRKPKIIEIPNVNTFSGCIPSGYDLTVYEKGTDPSDIETEAYVLYGWDEIGMFDDEFKNPAYCFSKMIEVA